MSNLSRRSFLRTGLAGGATLAVSTVSTAALAAKPAKGLYIPGTYSAKAAGIGDIVVTMTFDENRITDVVLNVAHETPSIGQAAAERLKSSLMAAQSAQIDVVSGASITSNAVMKAAGKCIAQAKGEIPVEVVSNGADADADSGDWLGKAPEIAEKSITATYTTDVLVVGCGTGGLFAVCAAAEEGAKVIGIDRFSTGTGVRGDVGGLDSRYQKAWGTKIDKFDFVTMMTQYAAGHINQDLVKVFCEQSGAVVDWYGDRLAERGVELWHESGDKDDHTRYEHFAIGHSPRWAGKTTEDGKKLNGNIVLVDYAKKLGARFDYNTRMVKLEKQAGRVTGCIAETGDGKFVRYIAKKGVVVATGGYAQNYQMLEAFSPGICASSAATAVCRAHAVTAFVPAFGRVRRWMKPIRRCSLTAARCVLISRPAPKPPRRAIRGSSGSALSLGSRSTLTASASSTNRAPTKTFFTLTNIRRGTATTRSLTPIGPNRPSSSRCTGARACILLKTAPTPTSSGASSQKRCSRV